MRLPLMLSLVLYAQSAHAEPQANASLLVGGAAAGPEGRIWDHGELSAALRGDCIFLREAPLDFGLGPYAEIGTWAFNQAQLAGGLTAHLPIHVDLPLLLSGGGHARLAGDDLGVVPGVGGSIFWGSRPYNAHVPYAVAVGLLVDLRHSFAITDGAPGETMLTISAQIDATYIAMPFILLGGLIAGPTEQARKIE